MAGRVGNYEREQVSSRSRIVAWSHGARFRFGAEIVRELSPRRLLDYGCGDGTFLRFAGPLVEACAGFDHAQDQLDVARECCAELTNATFLGVRDLDAHEHAYDAVFCMEVLEHCVPESLDHVLGDLTRLVAPRGAIVISVPIETGPVLLGKHAMRTLLGKRGVGHYAYNEPYSTPDLLRMVFGGEDARIERPVYGDSPPFYTHKGFNWRALAKQLRERFVVESPRFSPLGWSRGLASSQAWLVCRQR